MDICCSPGDSKKAMCENCGEELPKNICSVSCKRCGHKRDCSDS